MFKFWKLQYHNFYHILYGYILHYIQQGIASMNLWFYAVEFLSLKTYTPNILTLTTESFKYKTV